MNIVEFLQRARKALFNTDTKKRLEGPSRRRTRAKKAAAEALNESSSSTNLNGFVDLFGFYNNNYKNLIKSTVSGPIRYPHEPEEDGGGTDAAPSSTAEDDDSEYNEAPPKRTRSRR